MNDQNYIGYIKYKGHLVEDGIMDVRKAATALIGLDEVLRYFIYQQNPKSIEYKFEIPIRIEKGSWLAFIPDTIPKWFLATGGITLTAYAVTAAKKLAENDFKDIGLKDLFSKAFNGIYWVVKLATHLKTLNIKQFNHVKFRNNNTEVGISNENGQILYIPKEYLSLYTNCPEKLFTKISENIEPERELEIGTNEPNLSTIITYKNKEIFYSPDEIDEIILPELKHGDYVEIEGHITRGNENTNTVGIEYSGHILLCKPLSGSIIQFKEHLFTNVLIKGYVNRIDKNGYFNEKKPKIEIMELIPKPSIKNNLLF